MSPSFYLFTICPECQFLLPNYYENEILCTLMHHPQYKCNNQSNQAFVIQVNGGNKLTGFGQSFQKFIVSRQNPKSDKIYASGISLPVNVSRFLVIGTLCRFMLM